MWKYWKYLLAGLGALGAFFVWRLSKGSRGVPAQAYLKSQLKVIDAQLEARNLEVELGAERAVDVLKTQHAEKLAQLDSARQARVQELSQDPVKLARLLAED